MCKSPLSSIFQTPGPYFACPGVMATVSVSGSCSYANLTNLESISLMTQLMTITVVIFHDNVVLLGDITRRWALVAFNAKAA
jgi:hypothetical protein